MFDRDEYSKDDFICDLNLKLEDISTTTTENKWYNLTPRGRLRLEIKYEHTYGSVGS